MSKLTREQILNASDIQSEVVAVPEWGGEVTVRGITGKERDQLEASMMEIKGKHMSVSLANVRAKLVQLSVVDEEGKLLFAPADVQELGNKSALALDRIFSVAQKLSGLSNEDIEELAKNFGSAQSDGSISG